PAVGGFGRERARHEHPLQRAVAQREECDEALRAEREPDLTVSLTQVEAAEQTQTRAAAVSVGTRVSPVSCDGTTHGLLPENPSGYFTRVVQESIPQRRDFPWRQSGDVGLRPVRAGQLSRGARLHNFVD